MYVSWVAGSVLLYDFFRLRFHSESMSMLLKCCVDSPYHICVCLQVLQLTVTAAVRMMKTRQHMMQKCRTDTQHHSFSLGIAGA